MARLLPFNLRNDIGALRRESERYFKLLRERAMTDREKREAAKDAQSLKDSKLAPARRLYAEQKKDVAIQERRIVAPPIDDIADDDDADE